MARCDPLLNLDKQGIAIAINCDRLDSLRMPRSLPLYPKFLAGAAPEADAARVEGFGYRLSVHISEHQHFVICFVLNDGRDESVPVKFKFR